MSTTANIRELKLPHVQVRACADGTVEVIDSELARIVKTTNHEEALKTAVNKAKHGTLYITNGTYTFTELELENIVIYASPFVTLDGTLKILGDVYIFGYPKVKAVDTSQADTNNRDYHLEVDIIG